MFRISKQADICSTLFCVGIESWRILAKLSIEEMNYSVTASRITVHFHLVELHLTFLVNSDSH